MNFEDWFNNLSEYEKEDYIKMVKDYKEFSVLKVPEKYEHYPVFFGEDNEGTFVIAINEGGYNSVCLDAKLLYQELKKIFEK